MIKKRINLRLYSTIIGIEDQNKYNTLSEVVFCKKLPVSALIDKLNLELNLPYHYYVNGKKVYKDYILNHDDNVEIVI